MPLTNRIVKYTWPIAIQAEFMHRHDAGMIELTRYLGFFEETTERLIINRWCVPLFRLLALAEHNFHRKSTAKIAIPHPKDRSHSSSRKLPAEENACVIASPPISVENKSSPGRGKAMPFVFDPVLLKHFELSAA